MLRIGLFAFALLVSIGVFAQSVEIGEAKKIAENYLLMQNDNAGKDALTVSECHTKRSDAGEILYYIINFESGGFVIVSGDKRANPILAFSTKNTLVVEKNHPTNVFLDGYGTGMEHIKGAVSSANISPKWNEIATGKQRKSTDKVVELLSCKWNQNRYYNTLCPDDNRSSSAASNDYRVPNGCVALAMSQIMYYHRFPRQGRGTSSYQSGYGVESANYGATIYDYEAMADVATGYSDAIARLTYHAGVSIEMGYSTDGSGAHSENVTGAMSTYFRYKQMRVLSGGNNPPSWWKDTIIQSLDKKLPVYYAGRSNVGGGAHAAGHAFVCDGYKIENNWADTFLHFNFGWGSQGDGFYRLNQINPLSYNFIIDNRIIVNIEPNDNDTANFFTGQKVLTATYGSFNDGSGRFNYKDNTNCSWLISPQDGRNITNITLTTNSFFLAQGDTVKIYGGNSESDTLLFVLTDTTISSPQGTFFVNSSEALVVFTSDADGNNDEGFTFNYTSVRTSSNYCYSSPNNVTRVLTKEGSIDNNSGGAEYDSENTCYWAIAPEGMGNRISFAFSKFDLAQGDVIDVIAHPATSTPAATAWNNFYERGMHRFSTDNKPKVDSVYTVSIQPVQGQTGTTLLFRFRTDNNHNGTGFRIYWNDTMGPTNVQDYNLGLAKLSVYPNPANNVINVDLFADTEENIQIDLYDVVGKKLYSTTKQQFFGEHQERISVSGYAKGLYMLRINTSKGTVVRKVAVD